MMPLSFDWAALNSKIDAMTPNGNTNVTIGLVWAWHALTTQAPLSEAVAPAPDLDKVIILLTDGDNTESWKNSNNSKVTSQSTIDTRTQLVCSNIKAANIKLYTIRVINGDSTLLRNCATNPTHVLRRPAGQPAQRRLRRDCAKSRQSPHRQMRARAAVQGG